MFIYYVWIFLQSALYAEPQPLIGCLRPIAAPTNLKITESGKTGRNQQQRGETQQPITKGEGTKILARNSETQLAY